ncbi:PH domain-containing protein [Burkholderia multivorans]|uniref:PH domain-containing protein n=1 Tax=Burkholderia multivorans TaxID=87883 RepID=UPI0021BF158E|nr:PH domain-containing protein [Burkholderia multivorans]
MPEIQFWTGRPSQWANAPIYFLCFLLIAALVVATFNAPHAPLLALLIALPAMRAAVAYLDIRCRSYTLTAQRFRYSFGILSRRFHEVELYRIKDVVLDKPFLLRILGLSNITVVGFDMVKPIVQIRAIRDGENVREAFRNLVEARRDVKSVRVSEIG